MFYKFYDIDTTTFLININSIVTIYSDDFDSNLYHVVLIGDLNEDFEIIIDFEQFEDFERFLNNESRIKKMA